MAPSSSERSPLLDPPVAPYQRHPRQPQKRPTRTLHLSLSLLILGFFVIYSQRERLGSKKYVYEYGGKKMPAAFGVCSAWKKVYTVPAEEGVGPAECVVVSEKVVVDTGSLGKLPFTVHRFYKVAYHKARIRRRWGDAAVGSSGELAPKKKGLHILHLPAGHSLTPVSAINFKPRRANTIGVNRFACSPSRIRLHPTTPPPRIQDHRRSSQQSRGFRQITRISRPRTVDRRHGVGPESLARQGVSHCCELPGMKIAQAHTLAQSGLAVAPRLANLARASRRTC
jgi:hypothetical protein